jgi:hypothetical protein
MPDASYVQAGFSGGAWSKFAQGRYHDQKYRTALNVCLNLIPTEQEAIVRRPGTLFAGFTRNGLPGRVLSFAFQQQFPYTLELTDGHLRMRSGLSIIPDQTASSFTITSANPAVLVLSSPMSWATGDQIFFIGNSSPLLQNRTFTLTKISSTQFSLADGITGLSIDGSTLGAPSGGYANRILDFPTSYVSGQWSAVRSVQTETISFLLHGLHQPQALSVFVQPSPTLGAVFTLAPAAFNDGPYFDPFTNGVQANPSGTTGVIILSLSYPAWSSTTAYPKGAFVTSAALNYESLIDQNVGITPAGNPAQWQPVPSGAGINAGQGFLGSDVGRLVRLFSEPALWTAGSTYAQGAVISYNPNGLPGQTTYWQSLVAGNIGNLPGADLTHWQILDQGGTSSPAIWTWGKITSLANAISGSIPGGVIFGNMLTLAASFDGNYPKPASGSTGIQNTWNFLAAPGTIFSVTGAYVGMNYTGASPQAIDHVTIYPSSDLGIADGNYTTVPYNLHLKFAPSVTINLRAKNSAPANSSDGTLLGTIGPIGNTTSAITIISTDQITTWNYVWVEISATAYPGYYATNETLAIYDSQVLFFNPPTASTSSNAVNVELLGPALLYTSAIRTWRLGLYSDTTGWPTAGTYSDGRIWLSGVLPNRIDSSVSNGVPTNVSVPVQAFGSGQVIQPSTAVNFAPTDQYGNVLASSAISIIFNAPDANPIFWMIPDLQGIICGTRAGEWLVQAPTAGPISPVNIGARRVTTIGCANIEPRRSEHTTLFVQKFNRKIMEYFADVFSGKFTAPHITFYSKHLTIPGVQEIAYQQELNPIVWARLGNGQLAGWTYKRDTLSTSSGPNLQAGHLHALGSGYTVSSICTGPSQGGNLDALTLVTFDAVTGLSQVVVLGDTLEEGSTLVQANFLDDAITPTSTSSSNTVPAPYGGLTLNGLWPLNGKTVTAWLAGMDCGDYTVANGSIVVPYGDGIAGGTATGLFTAAAWLANPVGLVGFTYTSQGQIVRPHAPVESGARTGPAFGKKRRNHYIMAQLEGTQGVSFGVDFNNLYPAIFRQDGGKNYIITQQFTGVWRDAIRNDYDFDGMLCWQVTRPYIVNVLAIGGAIETQDI